MKDQWYHVNGRIDGGASVFGARRGVFQAAAMFEARGVRDECIVHVLNATGEEDSLAHDILVDLWFQQETSFVRFEAHLAHMRVEVRREHRPEPKPDLVRISHYKPHSASPAEASQTGASPSAAGHTHASALRAKLAHQRLDKVGDKAYQNMHIVPRAVLEDNRKLSCEWLFLCASPTFHIYFDGPDTAPHIRVSHAGQVASDKPGMTGFRLLVDTAFLEAGTTIVKPDGAERLHNHSPRPYRAGHAVRSGHQLACRVC
eukprot:756710-Amphidinium_carterae.1